MKPIQEQNNVELRETIQKLWNKVFPPSIPPHSAPLPPPDHYEPYGWSYNPSKMKYRYISEDGTTRFYSPDEVPDSVKKTLDPSPTNPE